jgi:hypothetical protein
MCREAMIARIRTNAAVCLVVAGLYAPFVTSGTNEGVTSPIPKELRTTIEKLYPGTTIVERKDLDGECGEYGGKQPGLVAADFNGDRIPDYAVVLKYAKPRKHPEYGMVHDYKVVVFVGTPEQQFKTFVIWEYESTDRTLWFAMLFNEKVLHDLHTGEQIKLQNPAVRLIRCGGGYGTYYWQGSGFKVAGGT